jgi:hypothetical protein
VCSVHFPSSHCILSTALRHSCSSPHSSSSRCCLSVTLPYILSMLQGLYCGSAYLLYLAAQNRIGSSSPSPTLTVKTQGRAPGYPEAQMLLSPNSTSVLLRLHMWPDNDCPLTHFILQYRPSNSPHWTLGMLDFEMSCYARIFCCFQLYQYRNY